MTAPLVQRLSLVVDASTGQAETRWQKLTQATRDTGEAAKASASDVARAANRTEQAQLAQADAAGRLRVAQDRLNELQGKGNVSASQLARAEENVASAQRRLHVAARDAARSLQEEAEAQRNAGQASEEAAAGGGRLADQLGELKGRVVGLVAGVSLADWAADQATAYTSGARGANTLAQSMNATVEQGGQLSTLFASLGLEANDLLEIQAEFATKIGAGGSALEEFGAAVHTNADGTVNWASTLTDALTNLQQIPDATERNRLGFQLFGEEGYKQLSRLLTSGVSVEDALAQIGTPFSQEDVEAVQQYDASMTRLSLASGEAGRTLGRAVLPVVTGLLEGLQDLTDVVSGIPGPVLAATAAAVAMGVTGFSPLSAVTDLARGGVDRLRDAWANATSGVEEGAGRMARGLAGARSGFGSLIDLAGGPMGVAMVGVGVVWSLAQASAERLEEAAHGAAVEMQEMEDAGEDPGAIMARARALAEAASTWDKLGASMRGAAAQREDLSGLAKVGSDLAGIFGGGFQQTAVTSALAGEDATVRGYAEAIEEARAELGELGAQQEITQQKTRGLTDLIADGTTSGQAFSDAVAAAALAEANQAQTTDTATAAIAAYNATTRDAVTTQWDLINARYASEDAGFAFQQALDEAKAATDDSTTSVDEARQAQVNLMEAALRAADESANAAVAGARSAGVVLTTAEEARLRADAMVTDLRSRLNEPDLTAGARAELEGLIGQLTTAQEKGDIDALVTLTGADEAGGKLDETTEDREAHVNVESRGGPAVNEYLDGLASEQRLALVRVESRGGPAVQDYLDRIRGRDRLAIIRAESRGGPAVDEYLARVAGRFRLAIIRVESRGGPDVDRYLDSLAAQQRTAVISVRRPTSAPAPSPTAAVAGMFGAAPAGAGGVTIQSMTVQVAADRGGNLSSASLQEAGRQYVAAIRSYEQRNGASWRGGRR